MIESLTNFWRWAIIDALPIVLAWLTIPVSIFLIGVVLFCVWVLTVDWK